MDRKLNRIPLFPTQVDCLRAEGDHLHHPAPLRGPRETELLERVVGPSNLTLLQVISSDSPDRQSLCLEPELWP